MTRSNQGQRIHVPDELREVLLEFTISYLLEQPVDLVDYAADYFARLRETRATMVLPELSEPSGDVIPESLSAESSMYNTVIEEPAPSRRRKSVFAEAYDPENDPEDDGNVIVNPKTDSQRIGLIETVRNILLFRSLDDEQMGRVLDAMFARHVTAGEIVINQGDDGDNFYVIQSGVFEAFVNVPGKEPDHIHTYNGHGSFGELALLYNMPRAATIKATTEGFLWAMDRQTFRRIILKSAFKKRKMYEALIDSVPMLKSLKPYERMNLADALQPKAFFKGTEIIKEGDVADGMYFVEDGIIRITMRSDNNEEVTVNHVSNGGFFGELALVTHRPRAASAYAEVDVKLAFLDVDAFERLLGPCMQLMKRNINNYEEQMLKIFGDQNNMKDIR